MQDSITHEALEALNQRSLEAQQTYRACSGLSDLATMIDAHNAFGSALIDLYRTGQLILAQPSGDVVEAVAELQLAAFLAGRGSVTGMKHGTRTAKPAPTMDQFRQMARAALGEKP